MKYMDKRYFWGNMTSSIHPLPSWLVSPFVSHITLCPLYRKYGHIHGPRIEVHRVPESLTLRLRLRHGLARDRQSSRSRECEKWPPGCIMARGIGNRRVAALQVSVAAGPWSDAKRKTYVQRSAIILFIYFLVHQCIRLITGLLTRKFSHLRVYLLQ